MPRPRAIVDLAVATTGGLFSFYAWSLLGTLALFHLWLPAVETQVSFFRSVGLMHPAYVILAARDLLLAAVLGSVAGLLFGWILRISSRAFAAAFAVGLVAGLIVTNSTDGGSETVVWLLRQVGFWAMPIAAWLGYAFASRRRRLQSAA